MLTTAQVAKSGGVALGQFTGGPARDYTSSVDIRMFSVSARQTSECRLVGPVTLVDMPARGALTRGIAGIDCDERNSSEFSLVGYKRSKLRKRPTVQHCSLRFPNRYPITYTLEVFKRNPASGAFGCLYDLLTDYVVNMRGESSLTSRKFLEPSCSRSGLFALESGAKPVIAMAHTLDRFTAEFGAVRCAGDLSDAKIDAEKSTWNNLRCFGGITGGSKIETSIPVDQTGLAALTGKQGKLRRTNREPNLQALVENTNRDGLLCNVPTKNAGIVSNRSMQSELPFGFLVKLVGVGDFGDAADGDLCRKIKLLAQRSVNQLVDTILPKLSRIPRLLRNPIARLVDALKRLQQRYGLRGIGKQLYYCSKLQLLAIISQPKESRMKIDAYTEVWYEIQVSAPGADDWFASTETADTESSIRTKQALMVAVTDGDTRIVKKTLIEEVVA